MSTPAPSAPDIDSLLISSVSCSVQPDSVPSRLSFSLSLSFPLPLAIASSASASSSPLPLPLSWSSDSPQPLSALDNLSPAQLSFVRSCLEALRPVIQDSARPQPDPNPAPSPEPAVVPVESPAPPVESSPVSSPASVTSSPSASASLALRLSVFPRLFDHFFVFGASPNSLTPPPPSSVSSFSPNSCSLPPRVLLRFPHSGQLPFSDSELGQFAFPSGSVPIRFSTSSADSDTDSLLYSQRNFTRGSHVHAFLLKNFTSNQKVSDYVGANYFGLAITVEEFTKLNPGPSSPPPAASGSSKSTAPSNAQSQSPVFARCSVCYVFLTRFPVLEFVQELGFSLLKLIHLKRVSQLAANDSVPDRPLGPHQLKSTIDLLKAVYTTRIPASHSACEFPIAKLGESLVFRWPSSSEPFSMDAGIKLQHEWAAVELYRCIDADTLITLIELLMLEYKIIVAGETSAAVSAAVLALAALLHPLAWQSLLAPVLPQPMRDFCSAPVPVLAGIVTVGPELVHLVDSTAAVWRMDKNRLMGPTRFEPKWNEREAIKKEIEPALKQLKQREENGLGKQSSEVRDTIRAAFERAINRSLIKAQRLAEPREIELELDEQEVFESFVTQTQMFHEWSQAQTAG